jgi:hypothetical protein
MEEQNNLSSTTEIWLRGEKHVTETTSISKTSADTFHLGLVRSSSPLASH